MEIVQIRINQEEGKAEHYYNYEFALSYENVEDGYHRLDFNGEARYQDILEEDENLSEQDIAEINNRTGWYIKCEEVRSIYGE